MTDGDVFAFWVYLKQQPLIWLAATLAAYAIGAFVNRRAGNAPLANPVAIAIILLAIMLTVTGTDYGTYFDGAQFVHFLLGPATVALAIPLYRNRKAVRERLPAMLIALLAGASTAAASAVFCAWVLGADMATILSLAPKSVTTPIAMGIAERVGGIPALTAVLVILTGILGSIIGPPLFRILRIADDPARGFALGLASHGIGTARAFQESHISGTFAGIAMGVNGIATALIVPLLALLFR